MSRRGERTLATVGENMKEKEDVITMDNGCVCCTVRGDLVRALLTLKDRAKKFDHVIIETTGLADPAPVAGIRPRVTRSFVLSYTCHSFVRLHAARLQRALRLTEVYAWWCFTRCRRGW